MEHDTDTKDYLISYPRHFLSFIKSISNNPLNHDEAIKQCELINPSKKWYQTKAKPIKLEDILTMEFYKKHY